MHSVVLIWRDESKEPMKGRLKYFEFVGSFFTCITETDATLGIPMDVIQTVELRQLSEEEAAIPYHESNTFREGEKSPWFPGMGVAKK